MGKNASDRGGERARYDAAVKRLLADKRILAWILRSCTTEFQGMEVEEIVRTCINKEEQAAEAALLPDEADMPLRIQGTGVEDVTVTEGTVVFDIRFEALLPERKGVLSLIVNVEVQDDFYPGYPLVKRGIYYGSRMISSQYGTVFTKSHYEKVKKVYSVWICTNPPKGRRNTITEYSITEKNRVGEVREPLENYDLLTVVMVCLGDVQEEGSKGILLLLDVLLSSQMETEEKQRILEQDFDLVIEGQFEREVSEMGSLGDGIWKEGMQKGIEKGIVSSIESLMTKLKMTAEQAMDALSIPEDEQPKYKAMIKAGL